MSAIVHARCVDGSSVEARALLDSCSTNHFITVELTRRLKLKIQPSSMTVGAVNGMKTETKGTVNLVIGSRVSNYRRNLHCLVVSKIVDFTPSMVFPRERINIPGNISLADPQFHVPRTVDLLIDADTSLALLSVGQIELSRENCELRLQKTLLGWVIAGGIDDGIENSVTCNLSELNKQITRFWELEDCASVSLRSQEDVQSEEHYAKTHQRDSTGRYTVRLPLKDSAIEFGNSRAQALRRFNSLQRRFAANPELKREYFAVIQDYLDRGHTSRLEGEPTGGYYMPHHAVVKPTSTTTKVRVVFDASAKSDIGRSLNQALRTGPTIQPKLFEHLLRFRVHRYVLTADIEQMYRQVWIDPRDHKYQRIIWQQDGKIETYQLNTVTFGVSAAPYLAIRTLYQLAADEKSRFPHASVSLTRDFYVDDWIAGANSLEEILQMRDEMIGLLGSGGFNIRKWGSNHEHTLDNLDQKDFTSTESPNADIVRKTLGLIWRSRSDELAYSVSSINCTNIPTKRKILSEIAKIFDPLGLLGPVVLSLKVIIQDCWKSKIGWDESVPQALHTAWESFITYLPLIKQLAIPRHLVLPDCNAIQIHGFCDASKRGYGACLYVRSVDLENRILVRLACAKSRVAPVSQVSIPRLELCGAVLLTRLFSEARGALAINVQKIVFWTDSEIVLRWLEKLPSELQIFEGNRVAEIQRASTAIQWRNVRSKDNLADSLSRGQTLRVGGRLRNACLPEGQKHPVLLPSHHYITDLIIRETHNRLFHAGTRTTLYTVRYRFWLVDGTTQVKRVIHRCVECLRRRPTPMFSKMGDLPSSRVQPNPIFSHVGVDFFGPVLLKEREHKNRVIIKGYGCIFVCMATKAVHIEIVSDLSTERFLAALRRFIGRRGIPSNIYSDNGSNFVGANNQLRELFVLCNSESFQTEVSNYASRLNIAWHFNPPLSPHFGGIWEAAVKSFKHHFYRVLGETSLTFEVFTTLAAEIEAILNSQPIGLMSSDPNDPATLTPAHFFIGRPLIMLPQPDCTTIPRNRLTIWRFVTKTVQDFWKTWHIDYLSEFQKRQKSTKGKGELSKNSVVVVIEKDHQCNRWPLGVVLDTYLGSDGVTRVVKIRTSQGEYLRNVTRLCPMPHISDLVDI